MNVGENHGSADKDGDEATDDGENDVIWLIKLLPVEAPINVYQYKPAGDVNATKTMTPRFMMHSARRWW